jgi:hypothetical protein
MQEAVQAVIDRVENDTDVKDYFSAFDIASATEAIDTPHILWALRSVDFRPLATSQTAGITNDIEIIIGITVTIGSDDEAVTMAEMLQALELIDNALEKDDITYGNKLQNLLLNFDSFETLKEGDRNLFKAEGSITLTVQPYAGGSV